MLGNRQSYRTRQLVAVALDEGVEGLVNVELRIQVLRRNSIQRRRCLVAARSGLRCLNGSGRVALNDLCQLVCLVSNNTISEFGMLTETTR